MASLLGTLHFWTSRENLFHNNDANIGFYNYHCKNGNQQQQQFLLNSLNYNEEFKQFCEERGVPWYLNNKRPEKLRENLKEVEELLASYKFVYSKWKSRNVLLLMLNNGALIKIWMKAGSGDIAKIRIDKYLIGKLLSDHIVHVLFLESTIIISYTEPKITLIQLSKKLLTKDGNSIVVFEKLNSLDPKIFNIDISGPNRRRFERKLSPSVQNDQLLIWWMTKSEDVPGPWSPPTSEKEKANLHVYNINRNDLQLQCYTRTKFDPIWASFSHLHLNEIHTVEQSIKEGQIQVNLCTYHVSKAKLMQTSLTTIPLKSLVVCKSMSHTEDRIVLGCKDGSLIMYDYHKKTTQITKGSFIPSAMSWHPCGALLMVASDKGQLQCYDMALNILNLQLLTENPHMQSFINLSTFFKSSPHIVKLLWNPLEYSPLSSEGFADNTHTLLIGIHKGPLGVLVLESGAHNKGLLTAMELASQYVKFSQFDEAISLLLGINWNIDAELCFKCLTLIVVSLLKLPLDEHREIQLELALGSYYSTPYPLSDVVTLEYHHKMTCLARRFFHHLLRNERFEKAFLLAVDIGARDLFMDIYYIAKDKNEKVLSQAALERANQLEMGSGSSLLDDESDRDSYSSSCTSNSRDSYTSSSGNDKMERSQTRWDSTSTQSHSNWSTNENYQSGGKIENNVPSTSYSRANIKAPQVMSDISEEISDDEDYHGTVHVVHFGIV